MVNTNFPKAPPHPSILKANPEILKDVDDRISFDNKSSQWSFEDNQDGDIKEYQYNFILEKWIPISVSGLGIKRDVDEAQLEAEEEENKRTLKNLKKQKMQELRGNGKTSSENDQYKSNKGVFVSNLPNDVTEEEIAAVFGKYGVIAEDFGSGKRRIKLYYEDDKFKNEALVIYHSSESVDLAIQMLDNSAFRINDSRKIQVQIADFKRSNSSTAYQKKVLTAKEKKAIQKKKEILKHKLEDWEGDDNDRIDEIKSKIWAKIVYIESMFRPDEMESDPLLELDIKEDIQEECDKLGIGNSITKINCYRDKGIVTVKFKNVDSSKKCIESFDDRYFDGLRIKAKLYNGQDLH